MTAALLLTISLAVAGSPHWDPTVAGAVSAYNQGVEALNEGDPATAQGHFQRSVRRDPDCGSCRDALALSLLHQNRSDEALVMAREVHAAFPDQAEAGQTLSEAAFAAGSFDESVAVAEALLLADPQCFTALSLLVQGLLRVGDTARARAALQQGSAHHDAGQIACELGQVAIEEEQLAEARGLLEACRGADSPDMLSALESRLLLAEGRYTEAGGALGPDDDPELSAAYKAYGLMNRGDYAAAATALRQLLEQNPKDAETATLLGLCELSLDNTDAAMAALEQAFDGETWIQVDARGGVSGILTASGERAFRTRMREGAAHLVRLQAEVGRVDDAEATLERARSELGPSGELAAAELSLLVATERYAEAAALAVRSLEQWNDSTLLVVTASVFGATFPEAVTPELERALLALGEWRSVYNAAVDASNAGEVEACLSRIEAAPAIADDEGRTRMAWLAHGCAATAGSLDAADRWLIELGGPSAADPLALLNHAWLYVDAGRLDEAATMAAAIEPPADPPTAVDDLRTLRAWVALEQEDLARALSIVAEGPVDPSTKVNLAVGLANAQRYAEALPWLEAACPQLSEAAQRAHCEATLEGVRDAAGD